MDSCDKEIYTTIVSGLCFEVMISCQILSPAGQDYIFVGIFWLLSAFRINMSQLSQF